MNHGLVFLDFDGVICDSLLETLVSSWRGYHRLQEEQEPAAVPVTLHRAFGALRPFVRAGEDFILIQELIAGGAEIASQREFDEQLARRGEQQMAAFKRAFYAARSELLETQREWWLRLNILYLHVIPCLLRWAGSPLLYILSTKKAEFILEILTAKGIDFHPQRVLSCEARQKKDTILRTLREHPADRALFIDDQIDHLASEWATDVRIRGILASWGYVQPHWLSDSRGIEVLRPDQLVPLLESWLEG